MEPQLRERGRRQHAVVRALFVLLLSLEAALAGAAALHVGGGNAVVWLALNSVLLLWCGVKQRQRPSCCQ